MKESSIWIVAVSGGPDSMALLDMLHKKGYQLVVAHVNYLTRPTSLRDENIVRKYCQEHEIPFRMKEFIVEKVDNFQHDARDFRYEFFRELVEVYNAEGVATGHHFNDDLETYLFQKERKMYSDVIGMAKKTKIKGIDVWRPILKYTKEEILEYCDNYKIEYGIDESNLELNYSRNRIRDKIKRMDKEEYEDLVSSMKREKTAWKEFTLAMFESVNSWERLVPLKTYAKLDKSKRFLYLREWLRINGVEVHKLSEDYLKEIDRNILKKTAKYQFGNQMLMTSYDQISLFYKEDYEVILDKVKFFKTKHFSLVEKGRKIQGVTVFEDDFPLIIRNARDGDKIEMRYGNKKVNRFFIDEKISHAKRYSWPVIENAKGRIIFVSGIGCDLHHYSNNPNFYMVE